MQPVSNPWRQIFQVDPVAIHTFNSGRKHFKDIGKLTVYQKNDGSFWNNINHGFTYEIVKETVFYKLVYEHFTSYLKESIKGGFVAMSFENGSGKLNEWQGLIRKIGSLEEFSIIQRDPTVKRKIQFHCPDISKQTIHSENWSTSIYKWGGMVQDTILDKTQKVFAGGSQHEDYAQKTKRWIRNSWKAFRVKVHDTKESMKEKLNMKSQGEGQGEVGRKGKKRRQTNEE